jgi:DNA-binding NtrC family response regulator
MEQERRLNSPQSASILIADEERLSREALGSVLWQRGHEVFVAEDGLSALAILERERPRLVILSLRLLGTLGRALLCELKARRPNCGFIVLCPDYNQDDTVVNAVLECGVLDVLSKSTSLDRLLLAVEVGDILTIDTDTPTSSGKGDGPRVGNGMRSAA